ncbi:7140_t:CDS:2 [Paraglomus brasilianum]|uniref:7140_t:CDS:1 n=1 Tax=Paraglomus brasilianum TaxID=144538 RepID=A0A9N9C5Z0_9GLOM|nr:7140_t:CDS:2 [Paraglomus brasilianum]
MDKPQVGIASVSVYQLSIVNTAKVKEGMKEAGLIGYRFNSIGVSDGIIMGTTSSLHV